MLRVLDYHLGIFLEANNFTIFVNGGCCLTFIWQIEIFQY